MLLHSKASYRVNSWRLHVKHHMDGMAMIVKINEGGSVKCSLPSTSLYDGTELICVHLKQMISPVSPDVCTNARSSEIK